MTQHVVPASPAADRWRLATRALGMSLCLPPLHAGNPRLAALWHLSSDRCPRDSSPCPTNILIADPTPYCPVGLHVKEKRRS